MFFFKKNTKIISPRSDGAHACVVLWCCQVTPWLSWCISRWVRYLWGFTRTLEQAISTFVVVFLVTNYVVFFESSSSEIVNLMFLNFFFDLKWCESKHTRIGGNTEIKNSQIHFSENGPPWKWQQQQFKKVTLHSRLNFLQWFFDRNLKLLHKSPNYPPFVHKFLESVRHQFHHCTFLVEEAQKTFVFWQSCWMKGSGD